MKYKIIGMFVVSIALANCSNRQLYNNIQQDRQLACQKLPYSQHEECMRAHAESYDDYIKRRRETVNAKQ